MHTAVLPDFFWGVDGYLFVGYGYMAIALLPCIQSSFFFLLINLIAIVIVDNSLDRASALGKVLCLSK